MVMFVHGCVGGDNQSLTETDHHSPTLADQSVGAVMPCDQCDHRCQGSSDVLYDHAWTDHLATQEEYTKIKW